MKAQSLCYRQSNYQPCKDNFAEGIAYRYKTSLTKRIFIILVKTFHNVIYFAIWCQYLLLQMLHLLQLLFYSWNLFERTKYHRGLKIVCNGIMIVLICRMMVILLFTLPVLEDFLVLLRNCSNQIMLGLMQRTKYVKDIFISVYSTHILYVLSI